MPRGGVSNGSTLLLNVAISPNEEEEKEYKFRSSFSLLKLVLTWNVDIGLI